MMVALESLALAAGECGDRSTSWGPVRDLEALPRFLSAPGVNDECEVFRSGEGNSALALGGTDVEGDVHGGHGAGELNPEEVEAKVAEKTSASADEARDRAAVLDFAYLGVVYEILEVSDTRAQLRGPKVPPQGPFDMLMFAANRFVECRAQLEEDGVRGDGSYGLVLDGFLEPAFLKQPAGIVAVHSEARAEEAAHGDSRRAEETGPAPEGAEPGGEEV